VKNSSTKGFIGTIPKGKYSSKHHFPGPIVDGSEISNKPPFGCIPTPGENHGISSTYQPSIGEFSRISTKHQQLSYLVGGFNPFEKYESNWESSPNKGENKTYLKPPTSYFFWGGVFSICACDFFASAFPWSNGPFSSNVSAGKPHQRHLPTSVVRVVRVFVGFDDKESVELMLTTF